MRGGGTKILLCYFINVIIKTLYTSSFIVVYVTYFAHQKSRILLINALFFSHLNDCSSIWGKCSEKLQYEVQKCINFATKVASNGKYLKRDNVTPLLRDLTWINFNSILQLNEASFMYKNLQVSADSNVKKINFDLRNYVSQRITRNCSDVHIDYRRTAGGQKAVLVSGAKLWNSIPLNIRNSNTIVTFKSHMYQHLLKHQ